MLLWYFIVHDLKDTVFESGVYFGKIELPDQYPLKAPNFIFITPNGRFATHKNICTTFSAFHQETYTSTWNIMTMMEGMISFMTETLETAGIGSLSTSDEEKKNLALASLSWNLTCEEFNKIFPDAMEILREG
jgi:ubiquitin-protein ligase